MSTASRIEAARPRVAFDVPLSPRQREGRLRGAFLVEPVHVLQATVLAEVPDVVAAAEAAALAGNWVVGGLTYEAGSAWDPAQHTHPTQGVLAWFEVFDSDPVPWPLGIPGPGPVIEPASLEWFPDGQFPDTPAAAIAAVQDHIRAGDCYQVNLTTRLSCAASGDLYQLACDLHRAQPGGYTLYLDEPGVASVSPELFFQRSAGQITTQPMKGTAALNDPGRLATPKERAENLMIVDLLRNDLSRICTPGSVSVDALFELMELPTIWQQTSTISGTLTPSSDLASICAALFPCGSVTGAPKIRAMQVITEQELSPRGWYCGTLMVLPPGGEVIASVAIRTVETSGPGWWRYGTGSGIVADSSPLDELAEWRTKARVLGGVPCEALETMLLSNGRFPLLARHLERLASTDAALGLGIDLSAVRARLDSVATDHPTGRHRVRLVASSDRIECTVTEPVVAGETRLRVAEEPLDVARLRPVISHKTTLRGHYDRLRPVSGVLDVICHTADGLLTEGTIGTVALLIGGRWLTPSAEVGLLPGTLRAALLANGTLTESRLTLADLDRAEAIAWCNGTRGWIPAHLT